KMQNAKVKTGKWERRGQIEQSSANVSFQHCSVTIRALTPLLVASSFCILTFAFCIWTYL
ncbi:MAG TPA: hypothetical protein VG125_26035, partial [Pirellulales bacterium]|nr:hypothetical protein [Pirellulales bacterium]